MKKIIVPIDFSETAQNALRYAILFGQDRDAAIEVIHVIPPEYQPVEAPMVATQVANTWIENAKTRSAAMIKEAIVKVQTTHQLKDLPSIVSRVEIGLPVSKLLSIVEKENFDLIIAGTQGTHNRIDRLLGSVSTGLVKNAPIPILVVPEHSNYKKIKRVCIAVGLNESDPWEIFKAQNVLSPGVEEVNLVHIYPTGKISKTEVNMEDLEAFYAKNKQPAKMKFHNLNSDNLNAALIKYLDQEDADVLVVLGPHLKGIKNWLFQSHSKKITYQTKVPFLRIN